MTGRARRPERRKVGKLSGGQQAQLALTVALARRPDLLAGNPALPRCQDPPGSGPAAAQGSSRGHADHCHRKDNLAMTTLSAPAPPAVRARRVPWTKLAWVTWRQHRAALAAFVIGAFARGGDPPGCPGDGGGPGRAAWPRVSHRPKARYELS